MSKYLVLCLLALCISFAQSIPKAAKCEDQTNCQYCTGTPGCGWCTPTQQCLNGTKAGPNSSVCLGSNWQFQQCTPCQNNLNCRACLVHQADCFWCPSLNQNQGGCIGLSQNISGCKPSQSCPCTVYQSCSECTGDMNCQWCGEMDVCQQTNQSCQGSQPVYNYTIPCECSTNRDCQDCQTTFGCNWCTGGVCATQCFSGKNLNCGDYCTQSALTCDDCAALDGCAWCGLTRQCVDSATSPCPFTTQCPPCSAAGFCDACMNISDCQWCSNTESCQPVGTAGCLSAINCPHYCSKFISCSSCNSAPGCGWCDNTQVCSDALLADCLISHSCTYKPTVPEKCKFQGGAFVGGMFLVIGILVLVFCAFLVYKWKSGKRIDYEVLK